MNDVRGKIKLLKTYLSKAHPLPWADSYGNYPFYVDVVKPRPSLSKHDSDRPSYWDMDDANYMLTAVHYVPELLEYIEQLEGLIETLNCPREELDEG